MSSLTDFFANATLRVAFLIALHACALLTLGTLMLVNSSGGGSQNTAQNLGRNLGWFGIIKGTCVFLSVIAGLINHSLPDDFFASLYLCLGALAYASLARSADVKPPLRRILIAFIGLQAVATALLGPRFTEPLFPWLAALPGLCAVMPSLLRAVHDTPRKNPVRRATLLPLAAGLTGLVLLDVFGGRPYYGRFQGWTKNTLGYYVSDDSRLVLLGAFFACCAMIGAWCRILLGDVSGEQERRPASLKLSLLLLPLTVLFITGGGFIVLNSVNAEANTRTAHIYTLRIKTAAAILQGTEDHERAAVLATLLRTDTDLEGACLARLSADGASLVPWLTADQAVPLPPVIYDWRRRGMIDDRFRNLKEPFHTNIIEDAHGRCILLCHPWPEQSGDWLILRIPEASWLQTKGRAVTLAAVAILLTAFVGLSALVALFKAANSREWQRAHDKADSLARARGESLAYLSHELRTPLQNVLGYAELLALSPLNTSQLRYLSAMQSQSRHLLALVNDFLDLATIEAGRFNIRSEPLSLRQLVHEITESARAKAAARALLMETRFTDDAPDWVSGDAARLRQILANLVDNAVKFTERGGVSILVSATSIPTGITIAVRDTGPGIDGESAAKLFRPFERLQTRAEGTGLGLVMTRRLCEAQRGHIKLTSEPGRGSEFRVWLPLAACPAPATPPAAPAPATVEGKRLELLVVDDHPMIRELMAELLSGLGHHVLTATNGEEALKLSAQTPFDGILLDLNLPGLNGIETATLLLAAARARGQTAPRLVGLSAEVSDAQRHQALVAGMEKFLLKPAPLEAITALFPRARQAPETMANWMPAESSQRWRVTFLQSLPGNLDQLEILAARAAWDEAKAEIHYLKNGALVAADSHLLDQMQSLHQAAQKTDIEAFSATCRALRTAAAASRIPDATDAIK